MAEPSETIEWRDLDFALRIQVHEHRMEFTGYRVASWEWSLNGVGHNTPLYELAGAESSMETTESIDEAEWIFQGGVKWDGCSDWQWNTEGCTWHGCSLADVKAMGQAMERTFLLASERIPAWDRTVAK